MTSSPIRPVNVNIMTPGCVTPTVSHVRTPTPPRQVPPPPYSPPSPRYHPDPTPSPASANIANTPVAGNTSPGNCSGRSVIVDPGCPSQETQYLKGNPCLLLDNCPRSVKMIKSCGSKYKVNCQKNYSGFVKMLQRILVIQSTSGFCCEM